jgi:hypothetical protein
MPYAWPLTGKVSKITCMKSICMKSNSVVRLWLENSAVLAGIMTKNAAMLPGASGDNDKKMQPYHLELAGIMTIK